MMRNSDLYRKRMVLCAVGLALLVIMVSVASHRLLKTSEKRNETERETESFGKSDEIPDNPCIRVLIMDTGFQNIFHPSVVLHAEGMLLVGGEKTEQVESSAEFYPDDVRFRKGKISVVSMEEQTRITLASVQRGVGQPSYKGKLDLYASPEGIVIVNELPVEDYLCQVVPSEMPSNFALEALKAQAICARSYAYSHLREYGYPEYQAHVDDSVSYQVYGNSGEKEMTTTAVQETAGQILTYDGQIVTAYYFSTSCGFTTTTEVWAGTDVPYLKSVHVADDTGEYERELPWYRWTVDLSPVQMEQMLELNLGRDLGALRAVSVEQYSAGGAARELLIRGTDGEERVRTEGAIRRVLGSSDYEIHRQDGSAVPAASLLPSAFITLEQTGQGYHIAGGGYGHGIGMSQNGANCMAQTGMECEQILQFFYTGVQVYRPQ